MLQYLGNPRGTAYQRLELRALMERNEDPWEHVVALLKGGPNRSTLITSKALITPVAAGRV